MQYIQQPQAIEAKSFDIIGEIIRKPVRTISLPVRYMSHYQAGHSHHRRFRLAGHSVVFQMCWSSFGGA
jgi:hypothetical protein